MLGVLKDQAIMQTRQGDRREALEEGNGAAEQMMKTLSIDEGSQTVVEVIGAKYEHVAELSVMR